MSEDVCKANSTGQIGQLSTQQLSESLIYERIRSEQHRLNYERLRALYDKLQNDLNSSTLAPPNSDSQVAGNVQENEDVENPDPFFAPETDSFQTELIKSPKRCSILMDNFPAAGPSSYSNQTKNIDINVLLKKTPVNLTFSPGNSSTSLNAEDGFLLPGNNNNVNPPHNEILRQCSRWKELYLNLLDEFQHYKCSTDVIFMNNEELLAEKVREASQELELARVEQDTKLEKLRHKLDTMLRDRTVLQAEIKALRDELKEANSKIRDKTVLCETLQRTIDEQTMNGSGGGSHEVPSHSELGNKLSAAEGRVQFLQEEIQEISDKNIRLQDKIFSLIRESTKEITTLRKALSIEEDEVKKERLEFQYQHDEALQYVQTQQAYIEDLDKFVNERVERNNEVSKKVQDFASQVAQETEHTLQMLEDRLKKTKEENTKLEEALFKASKVIRELTEEARRQRVTASRFITHIYQILSIPPGDSKEVSELRTAPYVVLCDNIVNSIDEDSSMAHTYAIDTKIHMKELLKRITFWSHQFELQKKSLRDRVTELENLQIEQKKMTECEIERYRKKCEFYREILRQLRVRVGIDVMDDILKNVLPPHIYEQTEKWLSKYKTTTTATTKTAKKKKTIERATRDNDVEEETAKATGEGFEEEEQDDENIEKLEGEQDVELPIKIPPLRPLGEFQAQQKFGTHLTTRPFISSNLHNYLKKHERFVHILDNVEKYLKSKPEQLNDDDLENEIPPL